MASFTEGYHELAKALEPVGRLLFIPLATARVTEQTSCFLLHSVVSYVYLWLLSSWAGNEDQLSLQELFAQSQLRYHDRVITEYGKLVVDEMKSYFATPDTVQDFIIKVWFRTSYYYDKHIVHPLSIISSSYMYGVLPTTTADSEQVTIVTPLFTPKPYILNEQSIRQFHPTGQLVSKVTFDDPATTESPVNPEESLKGLFEPPESEVSDALAQPATHSESEPERPHSKGFLYRIKIRTRKNKPENHPTYGRYDLIRQRIKDCLVQPTYQPDGNIGPNMVRFTWHVCGHYDRVTGTGGSSGGTMRFAQEFNDVGNTGLNTAKSYLDQIHEEFPWISFADLYTLGGVMAIEALGGPIIQWEPGRTDCPDSKKVPPIGRLPNGTLGSDHIHEVFTTRLGFTDEETVALIGGGHSLGGCHLKFSGFDGPWTEDPFKWDNEFFKLLLQKDWTLEEVPRSGMKQYQHGHLMMLNTDMEMVRNPEFRKYTERFAHDLDYFNEQFSKAFAKLLELGVVRDEDGVQRAKI